MRFSVDTASTVPIYTQLTEQIARAILTGELAPGTKLPPAKELAVSLDINVHTALHAYQDLRDGGLVELRRGRGTIVAKQTAESAHHMQAIASAVIQARGDGMSVTALRAAFESALGQAEQTVRGRTTP